MAGSRNRVRLDDAVPLHPFPARMAPALALKRLPEADGRPLVVLDPMMGSGTIPVLAGMRGHTAIGFDSDPLAVLLAKTWASPLNEKAFLAAAGRVQERARTLFPMDLPTDDPKTVEFIQYWFDPIAQQRLSALVAAIKESSTKYRNALWVTFSRLIITKDNGASLARDVSHSRPHRVKDETNFNPIEKFLVIAKDVARRHASIGTERPASDRMRLERGDSRSLKLDDGAVDVVITSPPYLIAIDYLRGHKLSLVWMGYSLDWISRLRFRNIGSEQSRSKAEIVNGQIIELLVAADDLPARHLSILDRYITDMNTAMAETSRVLKPSGECITVVADATLKGLPISVKGIVEAVAERNKLTLETASRRALQPSRRYLPPPGDAGAGRTLAKRMRSEHCLTFTRTP